jgi:predicted DNA-binding transcriptional regulator AlpA
MKPQSIESPFWRLPTALQFTAISRSTWLDLVKAGEAPAPIKVPGRRVVVWNAREVRQWMECLPRTTELSGAMK